MEPPKAKRMITSRDQVLVDKLTFIPIESSLPCMRWLLLCTLGCLVFWRFSCSRTDSEKTKSAPWSFIVAVKGCFQLMATKIQRELDEEKVFAVWRKNSGRTSNFVSILKFWWKNLPWEMLNKVCGVAGHQVELRTGGEGQVSAAQAPQVPQLIIPWKSGPLLWEKTLRLVFQLKKLCIQVAQQGTGGLSMAGNIIRTGIVLLKIS